jgi:hypothetical protein
VLARESSELGGDGSTLKLPANTSPLAGLSGSDAAGESSGASDYPPVSFIYLFII